MYERIGVLTFSAAAELVELVAAISAYAPSDELLNFSTLMSLLLLSLSDAHYYSLTTAR